MKKIEMVVFDQGGVIFTKRPPVLIKEVINNVPGISDQALKETIGSYNIEAYFLDTIWGLHEKGTKLSYLSNGSDEGLKILSRIGVLPPFEIGIASNKVGVSKPNIEIYELFIDKFLKPLRIDLKETLFIDDLEENLKPYSKLGGMVYQFKSSEDFSSSFGEYLPH